MLYSPLHRTQYAVCPRPKLSAPFSVNANELISYWCFFFFDFEFLASVTARAAAVAARKLLLNWRLIISKHEFLSRGQRSVLRLLPLLELCHGYTIAAAVVVDTATPNWGWSCTSTFACCCCCFFVVLVAVAFCSLSFCFVAAFPNCCCSLFVSGCAVAAASLALISGFRASGCRGLQVYIRMRVPYICMCVFLSQASVRDCSDSLFFGFTYLYLLPSRCTHSCSLVC